jgi:hypothetical protein
MQKCLVTSKGIVIANYIHAIFELASNEAETVTNALYDNQPCESPQQNTGTTYQDISNLNFTINLQVYSASTSLHFFTSNSSKYWHIILPVLYLYSDL